MFVFMYVCMCVVLGARSMSMRACVYCMQHTTSVLFTLAAVAGLCVVYQRVCLWLGLHINCLEFGRVSLAGYAKPSFH